jgi:hypothetical protein
MDVPGGRTALKNYAAIFDIDGTLANNEHRQHFLMPLPGSTKKDWDGFFANMEGDTPNEAVVFLLNATRASGYYDAILVTARNESYRERTEAWLAKHNIFYDKLLMRGDDDHRHDWEVKQTILNEVIRPEYNVLFAVDDRKQVVDMWRSEGVFCFQCADHTF